MVTLPPHFAATAYPGYFWNVLDRKLYSIKGSGILTPLKYTRASAFTNGKEGYRVSVGGQRRWMTLPYLMSLTLDHARIPVCPSGPETKSTVDRILKETPNGKQATEAEVGKCERAHPISTNNQEEIRFH